MMIGDKMRRITGVKALERHRLALRWSDGTEAVLSLQDLLRRRAFHRLKDAGFFARVQVGDFGSSVEWPDGMDLGADTLWLRTLRVTGHADAADFLTWRLRKGLSLSGAAAALGLSRRAVAYYSNGERPVPPTVLLACKGYQATATRSALRRSA